jgi:cysteine synthase B
VKVIVAEARLGEAVQGMRSLAEGYLPPILDLNGIDSKVLVSSANAFRAVREMVSRDGILAGLSSGAVLYAALKWAQRLDRGRIVMLFADSGWKYLNSPAYQLEQRLDSDSEELDKVIWW